MGLWLTLDSGQFESLVVDVIDKTVQVTVASDTDYTPVARLRVEQPAQVEGVQTFVPSKRLIFSRKRLRDPGGLCSGQRRINLQSRGPAQGHGHA